MKQFKSKVFRPLLAAVLTFTLLQSAFAQTTSPKKQDEESVEFKKQAVIFLRETSAELNNLRSAENRVSFAAELASLMWYQDEKEARAMFQTVVADYKQLVMLYDSQLTQMEVDPSDGARYSFFGGDDSEKGKLNRKFRTAMAVRQQIASSAAEHDPELAFDFYIDSLNGIANPERRKQYENQDKYFETQLLTQIAEKDAAKAADVARKSIKSGVNYQHVEILRKIYNKNADKGAEFADAITSKLKDVSDEQDNYLLSSFLRMGVDNFEQLKGQSGKKTMFSEQNLKDLSELLAKRLLDDSNTESSDPMAFVNTIEKFAPARAAQIRSRFGKSFTEIPSGSPRIGSNTSTTNTYYRGSANSNTASAPGSESPAERAREEKRRAEAEVLENVMKLGKKELPKDERDKIVTQARKIVSDMDSPDQKIVALSLLAGQVAKLGDKELASDVMKEASVLVNPNPKTYKDYMLVWMLASGYAEADPEKAFPLIESAIFRLNEVITGTVKVAEFIDIAGEIVDDGEVQVGAFGGSMVRELTRNLGVVNGTLRSLAKADLAKTKGLTNSFDRAEVRVLAKMMVLRAIMDTNNKTDAGLLEGMDLK